MAKAPPLLPAVILRRVLRVARLDGTALLAVAGGFALVSAWYHDTGSTVAGLLIAGTGAMELHGATLIREGRVRGVNWLIASQACLMAAILGYVGWRLRNVDTAAIAPYVTDDMKQQFKDIYKMTETEALRYAYVGFYELLALLTAVYQGGMVIYYARSRARVAAAIDEVHGGL
jgi:hypothetical protein